MSKLKTILIMLCAAAALSSCGAAGNTAAGSEYARGQAGVAASARREVKGRGVQRHLPTTTTVPPVTEETEPPSATEPEETAPVTETETTVTTAPPTETSTGRTTSTRRTLFQRTTTAPVTTKKTTTKKTTKTPETAHPETKTETSASTAVTSVGTTAVTTTATSAKKKNTVKIPTKEDIAEMLGVPVKLKKRLLKEHFFTAEKFPRYVYSNRKVKAALAEIDRICSEYGGSISFAYYNTDTGACCMYRPDIYYGSCSTIKAPYCAAVLESGADLDEQLTVTDLWYGDGGRIARGGVGRQYPARLLLKYAITHSDNTAYLTLVNRYGRDIFNELNKRAGADYYLEGIEIFTPCTARQLLKQYIHIYEESLTSKPVAWLTRLMQKTDVEEQVTEQLEEQYAVAHKYGSDALQVCYHDCAICYADSPFVLVIMTNQIPEIPQSDIVFRRLAKQFDILNEQLVV